MNSSELLFFELVDAGQFSIDDDGAIWRHNGKTRRAEKKGRYPQIGFGPASDRKYVYAHRIVWMWANGRPIPEGMEINHRDGDKQNWHPNNLELVTRSQNGRHATRVLGVNRGENHGAAVLTEQDVQEIRTLCTQGAMTRREIGERYSVHPSNITLIANRRTWRHVE